MVQVGSKAVTSHILAGAIGGIPKYKNLENEKYINPTLYSNIVGSGDWKDINPLEL